MFTAGRASLNWTGKRIFSPKSFQTSVFNKQIWIRTESSTICRYDSVKKTFIDLRSFNQKWTRNEQEASWLESFQVEPLARNWIGTIEWEVPLKYVVLKMITFRKEKEAESKKQNEHFLCFHRSSVLFWYFRTSNFWFLFGLNTVQWTVPQTATYYVIVQS